MSTKVFNAYRLKEDVDLWDFIHDVRIKASKIIDERLREFFLKVREHPEYLGIEKENPDLMDIDDALCDKYRQQLVRSDNNPYNLDVCITIRRFEDRYYLMAFSYRCAVFGDVLEFLREDDRLDNYEYWNNTDQPDDISDEEWNERKRCWDEMDKNWLDYLSLDIMRYSGYWQLSPWHEMAREEAEARKQNG
jgi:hypothetical protein